MFSFHFGNKSNLYQLVFCEATHNTFFMVMAYFIFLFWFCFVLHHVYEILYLLSISRRKYCIGNVRFVDIFSILRTQNSIFLNFAKLCHSPFDACWFVAKGDETQPVPQRAARVSCMFGCRLLILLTPEMFRHI